MDKAAKYLLNDYWRLLESIGIKGESFLCLIFQERRQFFSFSTLHFIICFIVTAIVKNRCCVFLASTLNIFYFIGNALSPSEAHLEPSQRSMIYPQNFPNQTCDFWLITQNQQTFCIEVNTFNSGQLQISERAITK